MSAFTLPQFDNACWEFFSSGFVPILAQGNSADGKFADGVTVCNGIVEEVVLTQQLESGAFCTSETPVRTKPALAFTAASSVAKRQLELDDDDDDILDIESNVVIKRPKREKPATPILIFDSDDEEEDDVSDDDLLRFVEYLDFGSQDLFADFDEDW
jgi:hypothetical protein